MRKGRSGKVNGRVDPGGGGKRKVSRRVEGRSVSKLEKVRCSVERYLRQLETLTQTSADR